MRYFKLPKAPVNLVLLVALSVTIIVILHGAHLPAERLIHKFAFLGRAAAGVCLAR